MTKSDLSNMAIGSLVDRFVAIGLAQDHALLYSELAEYNRLYEKMRAIEEELKRRPGDQRRVLSTLYSHENLQVRLQAAGATLALEPDAAREIVTAIAESKKASASGAGWHDSRRSRSRDF